MVLANAETAAGVDDIGLHLLNAKSPLLNASAFLPAKERTQVAVDPKLFDRYAGRYQFAPNLVLTLAREGERLFARATGQPKFELFAEGEKEYFLKVVDAQPASPSPSLTRLAPKLLLFDCYNQARGAPAGLTGHEEGTYVPD